MPFLAGLVPALIEGLLWLFRTRLGLFIVSALAWLGINWGTVHVVLGPTIALLQGYASGSWSGSGGQFAAIAIQWMGVMNFDRAVSMVVSAYVTRETIMRARLMWFKSGSGGS